MGTYPNRQKFKSSKFFHKNVKSSKKFDDLPQKYFDDLPQKYFLTIFQKIYFDDFNF